MLQDPESSESMRKAIGLLKILSLAEEEIRHGDAISNDDALEIIQKKIEMRNE